MRVRVRGGVVDDEGVWGGEVAAPCVAFAVVATLEADAEDPEEDDAEEDHDQHYDPFPVVGEPGGGVVSRAWSGGGGEEPSCGWG